jgi:hypothetical protein
MPTTRDINIQRAHAVLDWNRRHLRHASRLTDDTVGECFAEAFVVKPNGRHYDATRETYRGFLDGMKRTMTGIDYEVNGTVADDESVVFSMRATIGHLDGSSADFLAMLRMQFDASGKVTLWEEIYVPAAALGEPVR